MSMIQKPNLNYIYISLSEQKARNCVPIIGIMEISFKN